MTMSGSTTGAADPAALAAMRAALHAVAGRTVAAVAGEVPDYGQLDGPARAGFVTAVEQALQGFVVAAAQAEEPGVPLAPTLEAAYALGRGEARLGRSMDALLAAYRVGARSSWRGLAEAARGAGLDAERVVGLAELVFTYIDQLSAASLAGHADELATVGWARARRLEQLARSLITGADERTLIAAAERAAWSPPDRLRAVLLDEGDVDDVLARVTRRVLRPLEDLPDLPPGAAVLLVPEPEPRLRAALGRPGRAGPAVIGPARPWTEVTVSYARARRGWRLTRAAGDLGIDLTPAVVDADAVLVELVVAADPDAWRELRDRVLAPLAGLRPATAHRLAETLRSWLLHRGRREAVAADLHVHPQTVRYRVGRLRELFGERLDDPRAVLELTVALALPAT